MTKENSKPAAELLAPAGSHEILKAVAVAGADAIYAAGPFFGARAYANNLSMKELLEAIDFLHLHQKKLYLTVNTLLKEEELKEQLFAYILPLYRAGLDGVIIQDLGVLTFLKEHFPGLSLHASTQMSLTGTFGAALMKEMGVERIVPARELSLQEIKEIHDAVDIEIEAFIHGALCYSFSGQCLFSSMLGGRSGNRGRCAQPCRLPYELVGEKTKAGSYLLSPKDLCTLDYLPQMLQAGVYSLKIEGRMKQLEYAAGVTAVYRKYLDLYLSNPEGYKVEEADRNFLLDLGNRSGFTSGYLFRKNGPEMMAMGQSSHSAGKGEAGEQIKGQLHQKKLQEPIEGFLSARINAPITLTLKKGFHCITVFGDSILAANNRPLDQQTLREKLSKTGNSPFYFETLQIESDEGIFLPIASINDLRRRGLEALEEEILKAFRREELAGTNAEAVAGTKEGLTEEEAAEAEKENFSCSAPKLSVFVSNSEQFQVALNTPFVGRIYFPDALLPEEKKIKVLTEICRQAHEKGKELFWALPFVLRSDNRKDLEPEIRELQTKEMDIREQQFNGLQESKNRNSLPDGFLVRNYEELGLLTSLFATSEATDQPFIHCDHNLYAFNTVAAKSFHEIGEYTLPLELNYKELQRVAYPGEMLLYGYLPLMTSTQCVVKNTLGCQKKSGIHFIKDRFGKEFPVENNCRECTNIIYNSLPLCLLHQRDKIQRLSLNGYRLSFTKEDKKTTEQILKLYEKAFLKGETISPKELLGEFTNGHLNRGVE